MTTLSLELSPELYRRLRAEADRLGRPVADVAKQLLTERLTSPPSAAPTDREKARETLRAAGLLAELSPGLRAWANSTVRLEDVEASFARVGGQPLSEIVIEQRGRKE